jgi:hypothetical protein
MKKILACWTLVAFAFFTVTGCSSSSLPDTLSKSDCEVVGEMVQRFEEREIAARLKRAADPTDPSLALASTSINLGFAILGPLERTELESKSLEQYLLDIWPDEDGYGESLLKAAYERCK